MLLQREVVRCVAVWVDERGVVVWISQVVPHAANEILVPASEEVGTGDCAGQVEDQDDGEGRAPESFFSRW